MIIPTLEIGEKLHKELWNWLSENPTMDYFDWTGWVKIDVSHIICACSDGNCASCPIDWGEDYTCLYSVEDMGRGLFIQWLRQMNLERRAELAKKIRDLPWKFRKGGNNGIQ